MHEISCTHCEFPMEVKEEILGKQLYCPSCKEFFTARPSSSKRRSRERVEAQESSERKSVRNGSASGRSPGKRRRKNRRSERDRADSGSPSQAVLCLGAGGILLFGIMLGLAGGYLLFSRSDAFADELLAEVQESGADEDSAGDEASEDLNGARQMILGKWVGGLGGQMTYEFFKDGTVTVVYAKKKSPGEYKILSADSIWIKGSTGEATMDMKLTPDELELTIHSEMPKLDVKAGNDLTEKKTEPFDLTLKFKRPGAAGETAGKSKDIAPAEPSSPKSGAGKGSPAKPQSPKGAPGAGTRPKR